MYGTHHVTLGIVRLTTVTVATQQWIPRVLLNLHATVNCVKILSVAQQCFYVAGNNETYVGLHMKCPCCDETKEPSFVHGVL